MMYAEYAIGAIHNWHSYIISKRNNICLIFAHFHCLSAEVQSVCVSYAYNPKIISLKIMKIQNWMPVTSSHPVRFDSCYYYYHSSLLVFQIFNSIWIKHAYSQIQSHYFKSSNFIGRLNVIRFSHLVNA